MARNGGEEFGGSVRGICVQRREGVAGTRASLLTEMTAGNPGLHWILNVSYDAHLWRGERVPDFVGNTASSFNRFCIQVIT